MRNLSDYADVLLSLDLYSFLVFIRIFQSQLRDVSYNWDVGYSDSPVVWILFCQSSVDCVS